MFDGFRNHICMDNDHDFARPYPLTCRKCGLILRWNEQNIRKYIGSYFENVSYQWTPYMDEKEIASFSVSAGDRPVFSASCDFSVWETPVHYVINHDAPGFSVKQRFTCTFPDGRKFTCLGPDNTEFERLVALLREMAGRNARPEDQAFIQTMLKDTEKKAYCCDSL